jgi:hypothetical protein
MSGELAAASARGDLQEVKRLINEGADVHYSDDLPLRRSVDFGRLDVVKYLISKGADPYAYDNWIFYNCKSEVINYIKSLKNGSINQKSDNQWNTTCQKCGAQAYQGFVDFECSKGCK